MAAIRKYEDKALNLISEVYDLYDAQKWIKKILINYGGKAPSVDDALKSIMVFINRNIHEKVNKLDRVMTHKTASPRKKELRVV